MGMFSPASPDTQTAPILKAQETAVKSQIPSVFSSVAPKQSPSKLFNDYLTTGNQMFKDASGQALSKLNEFANDAQQAVSRMTLPTDSFNQSTYTRPVAPQSILKSTIPPPIAQTIQQQASNTVSAPVLARVLTAENAKNDPHAIRVNTNGSTDYGLMQINSSMLPFVQKQFKAENSIFNPLNPSDSIQGARMLLEDNATKFTKSVGRAPTDDELVASYHIGLPETIKAAKDDILAQKKEQSYDQRSES